MKTLTNLDGRDDRIVKLLLAASTAFAEGKYRQAAILMELITMGKMSKQNK